MIRFSTKHLAVFALAFTSSLAAVGCGSDDSSSSPNGPSNVGGSGSGARLSSIKGKLSPTAVKKGAKISALVTNFKDGVKDTKQIFAAYDPKTGAFNMEKLPPGAKQFMITQGGVNQVLKFPKPGGMGSTSTIPDGGGEQAATGTAYHTLADGTEVKDIDLGDLAPASKDSWKSTKNPLEQVDSDGDGKADFGDDDIDGDGKPNASDDAPWSDGTGDLDALYKEWGWSEGDIPAFDADGDGMPNAVDGDFTDYGGGGFCKPDDLKCMSGEFCEQFPEECGGMAAGSMGEGSDYCLLFPEDSLCGGGGSIECDEFLGCGGGMVTGDPCEGVEAADLEYCCLYAGESAACSAAGMSGTGIPECDPLYDYGCGGTGAGGEGGGSDDPCVSGADASCCQLYPSAPSCLGSGSGGGPGGIEDLCASVPPESLPECCQGAPDAPSCQGS